MKKVKEKYPFPVIELHRKWDKGDREEKVQGHLTEMWSVQDLQLAVKGCPVYDVPLAFLDLSAHCFNTDGGLVEFATHMKHVNECDLSYPIVFDQYGRILDGRHRIVKALLEGHTTIKAVKIPDGTYPTYYKA